MVIALSRLPDDKLMRVNQEFSPVSYLFDRAEVHDALDLRVTGKYLEALADQFTIIPKPMSKKESITPQSNASTSGDKSPAVGEVNAGPCSNVQIGGSQNQATTNCVAEPLNRLLNNQQQAQFLSDLAKVPPAPFWIILETTNTGGQSSEPRLETSDEQGLFAQQLREMLVKGGWHDVLPDCWYGPRTDVCPYVPQSYAGVANRGVQIMGQEHWTAVEGLGKALTKFGMRVILKPNVTGIYPNPKNDPKFNLHWVAIEVGLQ